MYWKQPGELRTMRNYLELQAAVQSTLNVLDAKTKKWSVEVTMRKRAKEADAPGMFLTINAKDIAPEVFTCTLDAGAAGASGPGAGAGTHAASKDGQRQRERTVLVIRAEKRCVQARGCYPFTADSRL